PRLATFLRPVLMALALLGLAAPVEAQIAHVMTEAEWSDAELLAEQAHEAEDDAGAVAQLQPIITAGAALFGADNPRLILPLRMLSTSLANLERFPESTSAALQATRIGRRAGGEDMLLTLSDLARDRLDADDTAAAALLAAEMVIQDTADDGTPGPYAQEGAALWALALLRAGHPDDALARLLPVLRLAPENQSSDAADLIDLFDTEADVTDDAKVTVWTNRALDAEAARDRDDQTLLQGLDPLYTALQQNEATTADRAGRQALSLVAADDPLVTASYFALLLATQKSGQNDLAATWALRLGEMPPYYLASLSNDPLPILETSADWLLNQGQVVQAVNLSEYIATLAPLRDPASASRALARLGAAYRDAGRAPEAHSTLQQALASLGPSPQGQSAALAVQIESDLALLARDQGDPAQAEAVYAAARTLLTTTDAGLDAHGWAFLLAEQRDFLVTQNRLPDALVTATEAVAQIKAHGGDRDVQVPALRDLAESQLNTGDTDAAQKTLTLALTGLPPTDPNRPRLVALQSALPGHGSLTFTTTTDLPGLVALVEAARSAQSLGNHSTARDLLSQAITALPPEHPMLPYLQAGRADIEAATDPEAALTDLRAATLALTKPDRRSEPQARDHLALHVTLALQMAERATGPAALNLMTEAFQVAQRVNDLSAAAALTRATARLQGDGPGAASLARQLDDADRALDTARQTMITQLASGQPSDSLSLDEARDNRAALLADLARKFPDYAAFADPKPLDLLSTAALLRPDEALLLYATADPETAGAQATGTVFALTHDSYMTADLPPRATLVALARDLRCAAALTDPRCGSGRSGTRGAFSLDAGADASGPAFDLTLARDAGRALIDPVASLLKGKTALIVVPDRSLAALPFHLLLTADTAPGTALNLAPWLIRQASITILPSVSSLAALRHKTGQDGTAPLPFLGIGDPVLGADLGGAPEFDCQTPPSTLLVSALSSPTDLRGATDLAVLPALPDTRCELTRAAGLFGTPDAVLLQADATETRVKALSASGELARYRVISFATHGLIAGELGAANAGLVLTPPRQPSPDDDGLLSITDIAILRLNADFVILSACNTAAGSADRSEGLSGLASAFFLAGARSVLVSHWPVYSDAATRLTSGLVEAMAQAPGIGRAEALRRSMLAILDDPKSDARMLNPAWWAPFLLAGDGG
ncbi:MAG: CHAT domain-containing protein, partial [bacterium]